MMKGFGRALRGEIYLWTRKRSWRLALLLIFLVAAGYVGASRALFAVAGRGTEMGPGVTAAWNFWPQFAAASRTGFFLVELLTVVLLAAALPREINAGAARDPLARGLSRSAWIAARACIGVLLPLTLAAAAVAGAAGAGALLFDAGDVMEDGEMLLSVAEEDLDGHIARAILHGIPPLLALAAVALALSVLCRHAVVAVGLGLGLVLLPTFIHGQLGDAAPWLFPDTLAGLGTDSYLARIAQFAEGYTSAFPETFDAVIAKGWIAPWPALILGWAAAILLFRRRAV